MEHKDHTYEQAIKELRQIAPVMEKPADLTRRIMINIENTPQKVLYKIRIFKVTAGMAATLLLCFWGYETFRFSQCTYPESASSFPEVYLTGDREKPYSMQEKIALYSQWQQKHQKNREYQQQFILTLSNLKK